MPNIKIVEPENDVIKKEQILELKRLFSKTSQIINKKIYIIKNCEKMNKESANTMLKFLEEPVENVIGFFITNHADNVIATIQSRCQLIEENYESEMFDLLGISKQDYDVYYDIASKYLQKIEGNEPDAIFSNNDLFIDFEKKQIKIIFQIILNIYQNLLINKNAFLKDNPKFEFLNSVSLNNAIKKTNLLIELLRRLNYNINVDLLLDKFVIEMEGLNNESI